MEPHPAIVRQTSVHYPMEREISLPFNKNEKIFVPNPKILKEKIEQVKKGGPKNLRVFTDFDFTLTKRETEGGIKGDSCFKIVETKDIFGPELSIGLGKARDKYIHIEKDNKIDKAVKEKHMLDWWKLTQDLVIEAKITKEKLRLAVSKSHLYLRHGTIELLQAIKEFQSKCYIVSAGLKGVVTESVYLLQQQQEIDFTGHIIYCMTPELYDSTNTICSFEDPAITSMNKNMFCTHERYPDIAKGMNGIVMGDLIDDLKIVDALALGTVIKIGFLNGPCDTHKEMLKDYCDNFDIVIANDGNMIHVAQLVKFIAGVPLSKEYFLLGETAVEFAKYLI